jgi:hypothetical protein
MQKVDVVEDGAALALREALLGKAVQAASPEQTATARAEESDL